MSSSRREFLKSVVGTSALVSLAPLAPSFLMRTALAAPANNRDRDTVLVVLQLSGGNDGLNTVVPYADDAYGRGRRTLRLTAGEVHKIDSQLGFHPQLESLWKLYQEGHLSVVQGVGYADNDRSHEGAMRDWHTACPGEAACQTGWVGRVIDAVTGPERVEPPGAFVGTIARPFAMNAERCVVPSIRAIEQWTRPEGVPPSRAAASEGKAAQSAQRPDAETGNPLLDYVSRSTAAAQAGTERVEQVLRQADATGQYPPMGLAASLKTVAQLIRADLGIRIFFTELGGGDIGGFDNHANQRDNHAALLAQLSESVTAFARDLQQAGRFDRVLLMTFSEFGRTLSENGRRGTGHGDAAPLFLVGGGVRGGLVGAHPSLTELDNDAPEFHTDFRRVYATVLEAWLGFDSSSVLPGTYEPLDVFA
jgi:uncharacterized protein (DUF1501 family)